MHTCHTRKYFFQVHYTSDKSWRKKGEEILMTLPANLLIDKLFLHNSVFQKSFELGKNMFFTFLSFIYILNSADLVMSERIEKLRIFSAFSKSVFGTSNFESFYFEIRKQLFKN